MSLKDYFFKIRSRLKSMKPGTNFWGALKAAHKTALDAAPKAKNINEPILPLPKRGGFLPLIPIFAALSALGGLAGFAAGIAKAVVDAKKARKELSEWQRHNQTI